MPVIAFALAIAADGVLLGLLARSEVGRRRAAARVTARLGALQHRSFVEQQGVGL